MKLFTQLKTLTGILILLLGMMTVGKTQTTRFVKADAVGANNGTSWTEAYTSLQSALAAAQSGDQIWVAAGTYKPGTVRADAFVMKNGVALYGGFNGTETQFSQRNWRTHVTILSGDIGTPGVDTDNSYRVINNTFTAGSPLGNTAVLDGFIVEKGYANGAFPLNLGGGMWNAYASPMVRNCVFRNNFAAAGGGMFNDNSESTVTNCLFTNNTVTAGGAGLSNGGGTELVKVVNCTFYANTGPTTINNEKSVTIISNSIIWGNGGGISGGTVSYSNVQGGFSGTGNLNTDPRFVNAAGGDFHLQQCSPAIDAGTNANAPATDFEGNVRPFNATGVSNADMGAYEYQSTYDFCSACANTTGGIAYVNALASGSNNGSSWANAFTDLQSALSFARTYPSCVSQIWVAAGTYKPTSGTDRGISFSMINGVAIYGGFIGSETQLSQRNWVTNETILSGDIDGTPDVVTGSGSTLGITGNDYNSYHVIYNNNNGLTNSAVLDGFTITGGNANGNIEYVTDAGGGIFNFNIAPQIINCLIKNNEAVKGGGIYNSSNASPLLINCAFTGNFATQGGAMYNVFTGSPIITNCTFTGNSSFYGGGMANWSSSAPNITNSILWGNTGGEIANSGSTIAVVNYSIIQGGFIGTGNLDTDPLFMNAANGDFCLQACSPAIDAGTNTGAPTTDLDGNARPFNAAGLNRADIGAYELQTALPGVPQQFGNNVWNVYAWNSGGASIPNTGAWSTGYAGYYVDNNLDINTELRWPVTGSPSQASGYQGCTVGNDNHSYSYKRKGFPSGTYQLDVKNHEDAAQLWINGTKVWEHDGCCDAHAAIWSGTLGSADELEFRVTEGVGGSVAKLNVIQCPPSNVVYVNANATGANNGTSWTNAFTDLQTALSHLCNSVTEIWVAAGTYKPTTGTDRNISFVMKNGVALYGGFNGTETQLSQRNWLTNVTTLSGDIGAAGDAGNSYTVVFAGTGVNATAILDGFTVTGATGGTYAAGIYADNGSPTISHCLLTGNSSTVFGGGLGCYNASPIVTGCTFSGNTSAAGGGMANGFGGMPIVTNCLFINNTATYFAGGGGLFSQNASMTLTNCTFSGNSSESIHCNVAISISNCVIWGNSLNFYNANAGITNCIVEGGYNLCNNCPNGNGNANPLFVNAASSDFRLQSCSPALNAGDPATTSATVGNVDLAGNPRFFNNGRIDIGAYEYQGTFDAVAPVAQVTNSVCTTFGGTPSGGVISAPSSSCPAGSTVQYSTDNGNNWSTTLPIYAQSGPAQTILTRCTCDANPASFGPTNSVTTTPGTCPACPVLTSAAPAVQVTNSVCTTFGATASGGSISAPSGTCPVGSTLQYSTDNGGNWSTTLPIYAQSGPAQTILTRCTCDANPASFGPTNSVTTVPGTCPACPVLTSAAPAVQVTNSVCTTFGGTASGGSISAPSGTCPVGSTLYYSTDNGGNWSTTLPIYAQSGPAQTILTRCNCNADAGTSSPTNSITTIPGTCPACPVLTSAAPAVQVTNSICTTFGGTASGGSISAPSGTCPVGSTLYYSTDNGGNWSTTLPIYSQTGPAQTILTRCTCDANPASFSPTNSITTVPGTCPNCPVLTAAAPAVQVVNSTCQIGCTIGGGSISAPGTNCPVGATLQYRLNGGGWSATLPTYAQTGPAQTIQTRCVCNADASQFSPESSVTTVPGTVPALIVPANGSATVSCPTLAIQPVPPVVNDCNGNPIVPSNPEITNSPNPLTCEGTRTYTYNYVCGTNTATWSFVYTIEREPFTISIANGSATVYDPSLAVAPTPPTVVSHCGEMLTPSDPVITNNPNPLLCEGTRMYAYTYTDCEGNTATWSFVYTVLDNIAPTISCPANLVACEGQTITFTPPMGTDNCTGAVTTQIAGLPAGSVFPVGVTTNTFKVTATNGQSTTCSFTVTVQGKPTITLATLQQTLNEGNSQTFCDTDANPVNGLQFTVSGACVVGSPVWRVQVGSGTWSEWSTNPPTAQPSNNQPHRYQAACDATCPVTYTGPIELTINYRASVPQNVALVADGTTVLAGEEKSLCDQAGNSITFNASCGTGERLLYSVDGGIYLPEVPTQIVDSKFHNYRLRCQKSDGTASCVESESGVMRLKISTIATIPLSSLTVTSGCGTPLAFGGTATCGSSTTIWYNAATNVALPNLPTTTPNETSSFYARCQNEAGCLSEPSNTVTFTLTPVNDPPIISSNAEIVCMGTQVTISAICPAGSNAFWNTGVTTNSFQVSFNNVTRQTYWARCVFANGCQSPESIKKTILWKAFELTVINIGQSKSAIKTNDRAAWTSQFVTPDAGPSLDNSTESNPTLYFSENVNKTGPRYWTIHADACALGTNGSLTFDMLATPEMGVIRSFNTHENNAPYFMYANREGWTELYTQNHPAYGFYQDNGSGGNVYDAGLPKGLYKLGVRYWDQKGQGSIYPSTRQPAGNVLAYQEYWFRIQSKDGVGVGAARDSGLPFTVEDGRRSALEFVSVMPNPVANILRLQVQGSKGQVVQTTLTDASGREILHRQFVPETNTHQEEFGVSELPTGMYFLQVSTSEHQATLKVVKVE